MNVGLGHCWSVRRSDTTLAMDLRGYGCLLSPSSSSAQMPRGENWKVPNAWQYQSRFLPPTTRRAGREVARTRVGDGLLGSPLLLHIIADAVALVTAFGGRGASGETLKDVSCTGLRRPPSCASSPVSALSLCLPALCLSLCCSLCVLLCIPL